MFKSLDSIASVVGIFMYLTISKFKQVLRSQKDLDYNTGLYNMVKGNSMVTHVTFLRYWAHSILMPYFTY